MKTILSIIYTLFFTLFANSQIDLNRCNVNQKQNFTVNILKFTDSLFIQQSYSISTLYVSKKDGSQNITTINGSPLGIKLVAVDPTQRYIAIIDYDKSVKIVELKTNTTLKEFKVNTAMVTSAIWYKNRLLLGLKNGNLESHDIHGLEVKALKLHNAAIIDLYISDENLYSIGHDKYLKKATWKDGFKIIKERDLKKIPSSLDVSNKENKIAIGTFNGELLMLNSKTLSIENTIGLHDNIITKVKFFDHERLLSSSFDKTLKIYNIYTQNIKTLVKVKDYVMNFDINQHKMIYSTRERKLIYINLDCNNNNGFLRLLNTFN